MNFSPESLLYELTGGSGHNDTFSPLGGGEFCTIENIIYQGNLTFNLTLPSPDSVEHQLGESSATVYILENEEGKYILKYFMEVNNIIMMTQLTIAMPIVSILPV